jgi:hypothetical protein
MACRRQRVLSRRRMDQRLDILPYRRQEGHVPDDTPAVADALPSVLSRDRVRGRLSER